MTRLVIAGAIVLGLVLSGRPSRADARDLLSRHDIGPTAASRPDRPVIIEPGADGQIVHAADVHMETAPFADPDGDDHRCTTWKILQARTGEAAWVAKCDPLGKVHTHLGDGEFVGSHASRTQLRYGVDYTLRVRHRADRGGGTQWSEWAERAFRTSDRSRPGTSVAWTVRQEGFEVNVFASGLRLPVNIAFVPDPGDAPSDPYFYVAELRGIIKVVSRDGTVSDYFRDALDYAPPHSFPGSGEQGLTGLVVEPVTGDVFASMLYEAQSGETYPKVVRFHSSHGGAVAESSSLVLKMRGESQYASHQISNLTIGPDGMLYVHMGDGFEPSTARDLESFRGKILRIGLDGSAPADNPFYDASDGITARDHVFAYGFRNPFGGAWRAADGSHYEVENGILRDRFAKVVAGRDYLWDGTDESITNHALYVWYPAVAPVNLAFIQTETFGGSGFPADRIDHAYVTESGPTYASGPQARGKRITEFVLDAEGSLVSGPTTLVEYTGKGRATAVGLAAGPDGLYFTDLYKDLDATGATQRGAQVLRVRWVGP